MLEASFLFFTLSSLRRSHILLVLRLFALAPHTNLHHFLIYALSFSVQNSSARLFLFICSFVMGMFFIYAFFIYTHFSGIQQGIKRDLGVIIIVALAVL
jgi:hypothetical protein